MASTILWVKVSFIQFGLDLGGKGHLSCISAQYPGALVGFCLILKTNSRGSTPGEANDKCINEVSVKRELTVNQISIQLLDVVLYNEDGCTYLILSSFKLTSFSFLEFGNGSYVPICKKQQSK